MNFKNYQKKAAQYDIEKNFEKSLEYHLKAYEFGHNSLMLTINNYANNIDRAIINYSKLKKTEELKKFLQKVIELYPNNRSTQNWIVRLSKLNNKGHTSVMETVSIKPKANELVTIDKTLGEKINALKNQFPEFDFYSKKPDDMGTLEYLRLYDIVPKSLLGDYIKVRRKIEIILNQAKVYENSKDYNSAIYIYTELINQNIEDRTPYNRLMVIYRKLKDKKEEIKIIENGIYFFESLKKQKLEHVMMLAEKYNKIDFAQSYIDSGKRIQYYGGVFDLYNPFTFIDEWKKRLIKLNNQ